MNVFERGSLFSKVDYNPCFFLNLFAVDKSAIGV